MNSDTLTKEMIYGKIESLIEEKKHLIICISGTPGTGKTTISKDLVRKYGLYYLDLNEYAQNNDYSLEFDNDQDTHIIDTDKLFEDIEIKLKRYKKEGHFKNEALDLGNSKGIIIDSHFSHDILKDYVDLCIIVKTDLKALRKRLENREYSKKKIEENVDAEIFDVCLTEATENEQKILIYQN